MRTKRKKRKQKTKKNQNVRYSFMVGGGEHTQVD